MEQEKTLNAREVEQMARQQGTGQGWSDANRGWSSTTVERNRFPVLTTMATLLRIIGWLTVAGGVCIALFQVLPWLTCTLDRSGMKGAACASAMLVLPPMVGSFVVGFGLIAFGEIIGVFRAIESNTYQLLSSVEQAGLRNKLTGENG
jgi:hypothetical protein